MLARVRDTEIYFDIEGAGLVPDGGRMREQPAGFVIHDGPGGDHTGFKPGMSPLADCSNGAAKPMKRGSRLRSAPA